MQNLLFALKLRSRANRIQQVTQEGVSYLDTTGQLQFFDFEACYQNWLNQWINPESLEHTHRVNNVDEQSLATYIEWRKSARQVGERNAIGKPRPYIEFHTIPPVRFYFKNYKAFREIADAVIKAGWQTLDLS